MPDKAVKVENPGGKNRTVGFTEPMWLSVLFCIKLVN